MLSVPALALRGDSSLQYWFRCLDHSGSGRISEPQLRRIVEERLASSRVLSPLALQTAAQNIMSQLIDMFPSLRSERGLSCLDVRVSGHGMRLFDLLLAARLPASATRGMTTDDAME